jgi:hypothetical protein
MNARRARADLRERDGGTVSRKDRPASTAALCAELGITESDLAVLRAGKADEWLTVDEICDELKISRRTFDRWRQLGVGPRCERLGGHGPLRSRRSWIESWAFSGSAA